MSGKLIKGGFKWHGAESQGLTSQQVGSLLLAGWEAARKGEPFDQTQPFHWVSGYRLYASTHVGMTDPLAVNQ